MLTIGLITGAFGTAYSFLLVVAVIKYAIRNARVFLWKLRQLQRFACDVIAIFGALTVLAACVQLMVTSFVRLQ